jgi:hypothetical protein
MWLKGLFCKRFGFVVLILLAAIHFRGAAQELDPLKYEVSVNVKLLPLFATDKQGEPVYDLEANELQLFINGKPHKISDFKRFEIGYSREVTRRVGISEPIKKPTRQPDRMVFIIIDTVFNSNEGLKRSKKIAAHVIESSPVTEQFILLENSPMYGLKYIVGPETNKEILLKATDKISRLSETRMRKLFSSEGIPEVWEETPSMLPGMYSLQRTKRRAERMRYRTDIRRFSEVLSKFKYALKTITSPKITYLISEGPARGAFIKGSNQALYLFTYLKNIARAVNEGGSVLYAIDPKKLDDAGDEDASGEMSLTYLARESGGKYFAGAQVDKVVREVRRATAAYYEVAFAVGLDMEKRMNVEIRCRRQGVRIHTLNYAERDNPYRQMEALQKKVFAIDVVSGGSWSRMVGKVVKVRYKKVKDEKSRRAIEIQIPEAMQNQTADIFLVTQDPQTHKTDIDLKTKKLKPTETLRFKIEDNKDYYFTLIEPTNTYCIYNRIK